MCCCIDARARGGDHFARVVERCTYAKWRALKRFLAEHGLPILSGDEKAIRARIKALASDYEFALTEDGVAFGRLVDLPRSLRAFVERYARAGQLTRRLGMVTDELRVSVLMDKGGSTTKCFVTVWDVDHSSSPYHTLFVGAFYGDESRETIDSVFGPPLAALQSIARRIDWPHTYGDAANRSNTDAAGEFVRHPAVQLDRARGTRFACAH